MFFSHIPGYVLGFNATLGTIWSFLCFLPVTVYQNKRNIILSHRAKLNQNIYVDSVILQVRYSFVKKISMNGHFLHALKQWQ